MNVTFRSGFNVIELAVVVVVLAVFISVFAAVCGINSRAAGMTALGVRGKDIFVAIIGANTDREPLGLPSVWPSDDGPLTNAMGEVECFNFTNSTDYFRYLYDEGHVGTGAWSPFVAGFDYSKLAGNGVPRCEGTPLTAEYNAWTIAKNVPDDMDDIMPVLVTRNIDARSLASEGTSRNLERRLYFDTEWGAPFGSRAFIMIRKGGAVFKAREKYSSYQHVYKRSPSQRAGSAVQRSADRPLKYLTPTHEVIPGDTAYAEGRDISTKWTIKHVRREWMYIRETSSLIAIFWTMPCLVVFACVGRSRWKAGLRPVLPVQTAVTGFFQCCACILYTIFMTVHSELQVAMFVMATVIQVSVAASVMLASPDNRSKRWDGIKYVLIAVLVTISAVILVVMAVMMLSMMMSVFA